MTYCSDMLNLQALYGGDRAAGPRARIAAGRAKVDDLAQKIERVTDAMLEATAEGGAPAAFTRRARALEAEHAEAQAELAAAERELASVARTDLTGADAVWRELAAGVEAQDFDARIRTRQLVADTFERIVIYRRGVRPDDTPEGVMEMMLLAKGGTGRTLRIDAKGRLLAAEGLSTSL